jgi:hypothetical protein
MEPDYSGYGVLGDSISERGYVHGDGTVEAWHLRAGVGGGGAGEQRGPGGRTSVSTPMLEACGVVELPLLPRQDELESPPPKQGAQG